MNTSLTLFRQVSFVFSKQRHSKLWKSMLPGIQTSTPLRDGATPEPGNESLVGGGGGYPLSSSGSNCLMPGQSKSQLMCMYMVN